MSQFKSRLNNVTDLYFTPLQLFKDIYHPSTLTENNISNTSNVNIETTYSNISPIVTSPSFNSYTYSKLLKRSNSLQKIKAITKKLTESCYEGNEIPYSNTLNESKTIANNVSIMVDSFYDNYKLKKNFSIYQMLYTTPSQIRTRSSRSSEKIRKNISYLTEKMRSESKNRREIQRQIVKEKEMQREERSLQKNGGLNRGNYYGMITHNYNNYYNNNHNQNNKRRNYFVETSTLLDKQENEKQNIGYNKTQKSKVRFKKFDLNFNF